MTLAADELRRRIAALAPHGILANGYEGLLALPVTGAIPVFALMGDPYHLVRWYGWWYSCYRNPFRHNFKEGLSSVVYQYLLNRCLRPQLRRADRLGATAAHHARWYARFSGRPCLHYCVPLQDISGHPWRESRMARCAGRTKYKLIHVGNTGGTTNRPGILDFVQTILPRLDTMLGPERFEVHFIGQADNLEPCLQDVCARRSNIILRGKLSPMDDEFLSADLMFVPNPIRLGNRTRIASAWSFGCPVVSHRANLYGMPQLRHGENVLLSDDASGIAQQINAVLQDPVLAERLSVQGRKAFEEHFVLERAGRRIAEDLLAMMP